MAQFFLETAPKCYGWTEERQRQGLWPRGELERLVLDPTASSSRGGCGVCWVCLFLVNFLGESGSPRYPFFLKNNFYIGFLGKCKLWVQTLPNRFAVEKLTNQPDQPTQQRGANSLSHKRVSARFEKVFEVKMDKVPGEKLGINVDHLEPGGFWGSPC